MAKGEIYLPALKGRFGVRFYYVALMTLGQVADLIRVGKEIYDNEELSKMIQRELRGDRSKSIAAYLLGGEERFFNAMVVGVYGGAPDWKHFHITEGVSEVDASSLPLDTVNSFGFLKFTGKESLFPLDGQHRLAGIREALKSNTEEAGELAKEELAVIFVSHDSKTDEGRQRSRRLFTVLNKKAKPVDKNEIIALDEDDVMAIACRWLVEEYKPLMGGRVWYTASLNIPSTGKNCLTTIGTLYYVLEPLFEAFSRRSKVGLKDNRPDEEWLGFYFHVAKAFFGALAENVPSIQRFTMQDDFGKVAAKQRRADGGHLLFRGAGLRAFAQVVAALVAERSPIEAETPGYSVTSAKRQATRYLNAAVKQAAALPMELDEAPHVDILWEPDRKRMAAGRMTLDRDLMLDMLGKYANRNALRRRYAKALGREGEEVSLPSE